MAVIGLQNTPLTMNATPDVKNKTQNYCHGSSSVYAQYQKLMVGGAGKFAPDSFPPSRILSQDLLPKFIFRSY